MVLNKANPIKLDRDFFVQDASVEVVILKQIKLKIFAGDSEKACQCRFALVPYLTPPASEEVQKRLPPPVVYQIQPLPHKIKLNFSKTKCQALVGDPVRVSI